MRLFVGVWPPPEVRTVLSTLPRPDLPSLRWTAPDRWHVTLAFLGEVPDGEHDAWATALEDAARRVAASPVAVLGPATTLLGTSVLCVPVAGLEAAAAAVRTAAIGLDLGHRLDPRPFTGHLTLARSRRRSPGASGDRMPPGVAGAPVSARWVVGKLSLVASRAGRPGARYETLLAATVR